MRGGVHIATYVALIAPICQSTPWSIRESLLWLRDRYGNISVMVTENGIGSTTERGLDDRHRQVYLSVSTLTVARTARNRWRFWGKRFPSNKGYQRLQLNTKTFRTFERKRYKRIEYGGTEKSTERLYLLHMNPCKRVRKTSTEVP